MLNYGFTFQPISALNCGRLHSASATMILRGPRLDQGQQLLRYRMDRRTGHFAQTPLSVTQCCCLVYYNICSDKPGRDYVELPFSNMNFYGNYSSPCIIFFTAPLALFSVLPLFYYSRWTIYFSTPRMHCLQSNSSTHTTDLYVLVVDNFLRWCISVYYAFHDQPEEDSGHFVYHCLNRDNANAASLSTA